MDGSACPTMYHLILSNQTPSRLGGGRPSADEHNQNMCIHMVNLSGLEFLLTVMYTSNIRQTRKAVRKHMKKSVRPLTASAG